MADIVKMNVGTAIDTEKKTPDMIQTSEEMLMDARMVSIPVESFSMPVAELSTLGAGVSSLIPALRTVTQTTTIDMQGLFKVANAAPGDILKMAKDKSFCWGAIEGADGKSKMAKLVQADPIAATNSFVQPVNPATMMMAVALFSIEQQLVNIEAMQEQIMTFLEAEKESKIEGDVEQLMSIISKYKYNWDNDLFLASNHKMVNDIQRSARQYMNSYQKEVKSILDSKQHIVVQAQVKSKLNELLKKFKYYRLSLYTFSLSSFLEIMLGGNFKAEYISGIKEEIEKMSEDYTQTFESCSLYLEKISESSVQTSLLKGVGGVSKLAGKLIGSIPLVEKGPVDEFLAESGSRMQKSAYGIEMDAVRSFAEIRNSGTGILTKKMEDLVNIYNHASIMSFDREKICLSIEA